MTTKTRKPKKVTRPKKPATCDIEVTVEYGERTVEWTEMWKWLLSDPDENQKQKSA